MKNATDVSAKATEVLMNAPGIVVRGSVVNKAVGPRRVCDGTTISGNIEACRIGLRGFKEQAVTQVSVFHRFARQHGDQSIFVLPLQVRT